jgi:ligand-binding sensor domain-containing protein
MAVDRSLGTYWFTGKQGSLLYDPTSKRFDYKEQNEINDPALDSLISVKNAKYPFIATDGSYWMVNWIPFTAAPPVLYKYDKKTNKLLSFEKIRAYKADSYYEIWNVFQQSNGTIWIYGIGLLAYYDPAENRFIHINSDPFRENGIDYDLVSHLYEDKEKNVWVCTNKGLYRFNVDAQVFQNITNQRPGDTTVIHNAVSTIVHTQNNGIWVASWGAGIFTYNNQLQPIPNPINTINPLNKNLHASYMIQRHNGEIWIGTQAGELEIYDPSNGKCSVVVNEILKGQNLSQLLEDHSGNVWIGSNSGMLVKCEKANWADSSSFKTVLTDISDIMKLYEDQDGHLWICTSGSGYMK